MTLRLVAVSITFLLLPVSLQAMPFSQFDKMSIYAQAEFIALMVDATENALRAEGKADLATRVDVLFRQINQGSKISLGIGILEQASHGRNHHPASPLISEDLPGADVSAARLLVL